MPGRLVGPAEHHQHAGQVVAQDRVVRRRGMGGGQMRQRALGPVGAGPGAAGCAVQILPGPGGDRGVQQRARLRRAGGGLQQRGEVGSRPTVARARGEGGAEGCLGAGGVAGLTPGDAEVVAQFRRIRPGGDGGVIGGRGLGGAPVALMRGGGVDQRGRCHPAMA